MGMVAEKQRHLDQKLRPLQKPDDEKTGVTLRQKARVRGLLHEDVPLL